MECFCYSATTFRITQIDFSFAPISDRSSTPFPHVLGIPANNVSWSVFLTLRISLNWVGRKERLYISKIAKFESDFLKTNEDISPYSRVILQAFLSGGEQLTPTPPSPIQMSVHFRSFVELYIFAHL